MKHTVRICLGCAVFAIVTACSEDSAPDSQVTAVAGADKNALINQKVVLDGSGSSDTQGNALEFSWKILSKPPTSTATLEDATSEVAAITPDKPGRFTIELTASGAASDMDTVNIYAYEVVTIPGAFDNYFPGPNVGIRKFQVYGAKLIATCEFTEIGGVEAKKIAQFDGSSWSAMDCGLEEGSIYDMIVFDNELYVTGQFTEIGCEPANNIARWNGIEWSPVKEGLTGDDAFGHALAIFNNELYVGGGFTKAGDVDVLNIAKWDGSDWSAVGSIGGGSVRSLEVYKQQLFAGGFFTTANGNQTLNIARFNGTTWGSLGPQGGLAFGKIGVVRHMAVYNDFLFIVGDHELTNGDVSQLTVYNGSQYLDLGKGFSLQPSSIDELAAIDGLLFVGGKFQNILGTQVNNIVQFDGSKWGKLEQGINGSVLSVIKYKNDIYLGGDFTQAGGESAENISIWTAE